MKVAELVDRVLDGGGRAAGEAGRAGGLELPRGTPQRGVGIEGPGWGSRAAGWTQARLASRLASSEWLVIDVSTDDERGAGYRAAWLAHRRRPGDRLFCLVERADSDDRPWQVRALGEVDRIRRMYGQQASISRRQTRS